MKYIAERRWKTFGEFRRLFVEARRQRFAGQTVTFIRTNTRKNEGGFSASVEPVREKSV